MKDIVRRFVFDFMYYALALPSGKIHWSDIFKINLQEEIHWIVTGEIRP